MKNEINLLKSYIKVFILQPNSLFASSKTSVNNKHRLISNKKKPNIIFYYLNKHYKILQNLVIYQKICTPIKYILEKNSAINNLIGFAIQCPQKMSIRNIY